MSLKSDFIRNEKLLSHGDVIHEKWQVEISLCTLCILLLIWYVFFRDIAAVPDNDRKPKPPGPALSAYEQMQEPWNAADAADWRVADYLAQFSLAAYGGLPEFKEVASDHGLTFVQPFESRTMMAYAAWKDAVMVLAFRGSNPELEDWIINCDCLIPDPTEDGGIHAGFNQVYVKMKADIQALLQKHRPRFLWITGHSLGGALATTCARDLVSQNRLQPYGVMTFGQPMIATLALAERLHTRLGGRFVHFANRADPVPRLPSFSYRHFGSLAMFTEEGIRRRWDVYQERPDRRSRDKLPDERGDLLPMHPHELRELQRNIQEERRRRTQPASGGYEWTVPSLAAHSMELYHANVKRWVLTGANESETNHGAIMPDKID